MAVTIRTPQEIEKMRRSGQVVREVLEHVRKAVKPGSSTLDLEQAAAEKIRELGATPAFKGYHGYPCVLCTSINNEVVHGIPSGERKLRDGDLVSIDTGVVLNGYYGDSAITVAVGNQIGAKARKLLDVTAASLESAIREVKPGATLGDVGAAVQETVEAEGFSIVRDFVGHGIGTKLHEDPQVPNFGERGHGMALKAGMVLAIEPMVNAGRPGVQVLKDGWTAVTEDGSWSAHFEHTVAVTKDGALVLTQ
ncbi:MAG: type I methionyl aminopeptidase [Acidobacteriaceae bacterium]